jgi:predicted enzyme related to lactoylglutathione lyase
MSTLGLDNVPRVPANGALGSRTCGITIGEITVAREFQSSRDVIIRTRAWAEATEFYGSILGLPVTQRSATLMGFETGSFCLYVEKGKEHGPVFDFLVPDVQAEKRRLVAAGCTVLEENASIPRCYIRDPFGLVFNIGQSSRVVRPDSPPKR